MSWGGPFWGIRFMPVSPGVKRRWSLQSGIGRTSAILHVGGGHTVDDWRLHDLRRTAATGMARLGVTPPVIERILNHATSSAGPLAAVYQRYDYAEEKREALVTWGEEVSRIVRNNRLSELRRGMARERTLADS